MSKIIIVHGEKPTRSCAIHPAFIERLKVAIAVCDKEKFDYLIISGGQTRRKCRAESEIGLSYLKGKVSIPVLLEGQARSTSENIRYSREIAGSMEIEKIIAITSRKRIFRIRYLYWRLWRDVYPKIVFVGAKDYYPVFYYFAEFFYFLYDLVDPHERLLVRFVKRIFRNAC